MTQTTKKNARHSKQKKYMVAHYSKMNLMGLFEHEQLQIPKLPAKVIVKTDRGLELGELVGRFGAYKQGQLKFNNKELEEYYKKSEIDEPLKPVGKFIRFATADDVSEQRHLEKISREEIEVCKRFADELGLKMKVVDAEHIFGGERIVFYFLADSRVDFRKLVKKLAQEYQTRIEMRQIGSRDEAKLWADYETCGQECCCKRFLRVLKPVNMRMAKMQKATLDPTKISGYCGRLKCCLRYEDKTYSELRKDLPSKGARVKTESGQGSVVDFQILTQLVMVELDTGDNIAVPVEEVEVIEDTGQKNGSTEEENSQGNDEGAAQ